MSHWRNNLTTGERIKILRGQGTDDGLTQQALAAKAGISIYTLRKAERDEQLTLDTLMALSGALHVDVSLILGQAEPRPSMTVDDRGMLQSLSRSVHDSGAGFGLSEPPPIERAVRALTAAWTSYRAGDVTGAGSMASVAVREAAALVHSAPHDRLQAADALATDAYRLASYVANQLGSRDLAYAAIGHAAAHARRAGDDMRGAMVASGRSWISMRDAALDTAAQLAEDSYLAIEPSYRDRDPHLLATYGWHVVFGAVVASRRGRHSEADDLLSQGQAVAARIGHDVEVNGTAFGPTAVAAQAVGIYVSTGRPSKALEEHRRIRSTATLTTAASNRLQLDVALAQAETGLYDDSLDTLLEVCSAHPGWARHQALPEVIARKAGLGNPTHRRYERLAQILRPRE